MKGTIARIFKDKGFGFIKGDDSKEYFMHFTSTDTATWNDFCKAYNRGEQTVVEFTPTKSDKGARAEDVTFYA